MENEDLVLLFILHMYTFLCLSNLTPNSLPSKHIMYFFSFLVFLSWNSLSSSSTLDCLFDGSAKDPLFWFFSSPFH